MICVPLKEKSLSKLAGSLKMQAGVDLVEIWIDQLPKTVSATDVVKLVRKNRKKILIVNKPKREKGNFMGSEKERIEKLAEFVKLGADFVDVGIDTNPGLIKSLFKTKKLNHSKTRIIVSYHNFKETPGSYKLAKILKKMMSFGADICKIATTARTTADNFEILRLLENSNNKRKKLIALCMGEKGKFSRVAGIFLGSYINYVCLDKKKSTAPGQLTYKEYLELTKVLKT